MSEFKLTESQYLSIYNILGKHTERLEKLEKRENRRVWHKGFVEGFKLGMQMQVQQKPKLEVKTGQVPDKK